MLGASSGSEALLYERFGARRAAPWMSRSGAYVVAKRLRFPGEWLPRSNDAARERYARVDAAADLRTGDAGQLT